MGPMGGMQGMPGMPDFGAMMNNPAMMQMVRKFFIFTVLLLPLHPTFPLVQSIIKEWKSSLYLLSVERITHLVLMCTISSNSLCT